jgi:hypothetical protein
MNFKKIAITAAAGAIMLSSAVPAFAFFPMPSNDVNIKNFAFVTNNVKTSAEVSGNYVSGFMGGAKLRVGSVDAVSSVTNNVNSSYIDTCNTCSLFGGDTSISNNAFVTNKVNTSAEVEHNYVSAKMFGSAKLSVGDVGAAGIVSNVVNTTMIGGFNE